MSAPIRIVGSYLSPYVRKVLAVLELKQLTYELDPIIPFTGDDRFSTVSPLRRVPVLIDDRVTLPDSTVICEYLEDRYPEPRLYPRDLALRARARWLEEFADSRMGEVIIWRFFNQRVIRPYVWKLPVEEEVVARVVDEELPQILDYLEGQMPEHGWLFGELSIADLAIASMFRNAAFVRYSIDESRWPKTASFCREALALPCFAKLQPFEAKMLRTPWPQHRAALEELGAPISAETFMTETPRHGVMTI
jgi:glutathione S-transferase